jgi:hypothetical protein
MQRERSPIPKEVRAEVRHKFGGLCAYCGIQLRKSFHADHVVPHAAGGVDDICNLFPACGKCNALKNALGLEEFRSMLSKAHDKHLIVLLERLGHISIMPLKPVVFHFERQGHIFDEALVQAMMLKNGNRLF